MLRMVLLFLAAGASLAPAAEPVREVRFEGRLAPLYILPNFDNGYLVAFESGGIAVCGPHGRLACRVFDRTTMEPEAVCNRGDNAAVDTDGTIAVTLYRVKGRTQTRGGIAIFTRTGMRKGFIDTGRFVPSAVAFAPDHSIWTFGTRFIDPGFRDYFILHHYLQDGTRRGEFLPRSGFATDDEPGYAGHGGWRLRVSGNRVGAALGGTRLENRWWIEFDLEGRETGRWRTGNRDPGAFTASGSVYAREMEGISVLDRATGQWRPVVPPFAGRLLGHDGDNLVFRIGSVLTWAPAPPAE